MIAVFLSTSSGETTKYADCLRTLGWGEVHMLRYDLSSHSEPMVYAQVKACKPDVIVYIGSRWGAVMTPMALAKLNAEVAPTVHLCSDAADLPWHELLLEYHYAGCFSLQVAIDGNKAWPLSETQLTLLTPVDPANFNGSRLHAERSIACGFAGNPGGPNSIRRTILSELAFRQAVSFRMRNEELDSYAGYCKFLLDTRMSLNLAHTGTQAAKQVKGRVVESGLAGCLLLEQSGAPTKDWFTPGEDFIEYEGADDAEKIIKHFAARPDETQEVGARLRAKVLAEHTPERFWRRIFERLRIKP